MRTSRLAAVDAPHEVVTAELVDEVSGLDGDIITDPVSGKPPVAPVGRHHVR